MSNLEEQERCEVSKRHSVCMVSLSQGLSNSYFQNKIFNVLILVKIGLIMKLND